MASRPARSEIVRTPELIWHGNVLLAEAQANVQRALRQVVEHRGWIDEQHLSVCRVPAPTFAERERAKFLARMFAQLGHRPEIDSVGNVLVPIVNSPGLPFLAVTAHMDTALSKSEAGAVRVGPGGRMHGPGVTDNGAGLAALIAIGRFAAGPLAERPRHNLLLVANVGEEGEGDLKGIRHLVCDSAYKDSTEAYLVIDGSSLGHITVSAIGSRRFEVVIEGQGGHSWNDFGRANPINALARAISALSATRLPTHPRTTVSVGMVRGGSAVNSIPCRASAKIDIRSGEPAGLAIGERLVRDAVASACAAENRRATDWLVGHALREIGNRPAAPPLEANPLAECVKAVDRRLGIDSRPESASTDANIPLAAKIPAVAVGAGGRGGDAHSPHEWYDPTGRDLGLRRLILAISAMQQES